MSKKQLIKPRTLKGFRDYLPDAMLARETLIDTARQVYRSYGFSPIDTPALEYSEILLGKGGDESDKQLFRFTDQGDRDVSMRFDLTVPFARFTAQHLNDLGMPFKRYHIGTVWRAEKPQKGRYREFMQCDFDTIGTESNTADIETLLVIHDLFEALGFERFTIRINNRLILNGLLEVRGLEEKSVAILRVLDKLPKILHDGVRRELSEVVGLNDADVEFIVNLTSDIARNGKEAEELLTRASGQLQSSSIGLLGVDRISELLDAAISAGIDGSRIQLDLSIARGLDYYTGTIYETFLNDLPGIGSVCSGGRYDNLAELFTSQKLPGVGASLGLDRLLAAMDELGMLETAATPAQVLVTMFDANRLCDYVRIGREIRKSGISAEVFPDAKAVGKQMKYANRKGFRVALIAGEDEFENGHWQVKDLDSGEQTAVPEPELVAHLQHILGDTTH